jgi:hypothetical protein
MRIRGIRPQPREILLLAACVVILLWQLFWPGFIGLADNRDFAKVSGRLCIGRADVADAGAYFAYFYPDYERSQHYCWESGVPTSQLLLASAASWIQEHAGNPQRFDIRWLGAIHALCFLVGWCLWLAALRPLQGAAWWIVTIAALWIFTDVGFISYLNSFYTDAAAFLGAMILLPASLLLLSNYEPRAAPVIWFGLGALLFITSKGQHGALAPLLVAFLLAAQWGQSGSRALKIALLTSLIAGSCWVLIETPYWYKAQSRFNLIFYKLLPISPSPARDLSELGLSQTDLPYIGQHAFLPSSPAFDRAWLEAFSHRGGHWKLAMFWLHHPLRALAILRLDLEKEAWQRRPLAFSNFQPESGRPPAAQTARFGSWSALRTRAVLSWPEHLVVWYALVLLGGPILALRAPPGFRRAIAWTLVLAGTLGLTEFLLTSLVDGRETDRHLLLFHLFTDVTLLLALTFLVSNRKWGVRT